MISLSDAIDTFIQGFCFTKSFTHPYLAEPLAEGVTVMRDAPRKSRDSRTEEFVSFRVAPGTLDCIARSEARGRYALSVFRALAEAGEPIRAEFKQLGYRLLATEAFMVHDLAEIPVMPERFPVVRVETLEQARALAKAARSRQVLPEHLTASNPPLRQYVVTDGERPVGWARSIVAGDFTWLSNVFVESAFRRRGIGLSLICRVLEEDRKAGSRGSVLLASHTGALLYPKAGYCQIGELFLFVPSKGRR